MTTFKDRASSDLTAALRLRMQPPTSGSVRSFAIDADIPGP
nr:hypothetical protein [Enterobacter roggenkampii]